MSISRGAECSLIDLSYTARIFTSPFDFSGRLSIRKGGAAGAVSPGAGL